MPVAVFGTPGGGLARDFRSWQYMYDGHTPPVRPLFCVSILLCFSACQMSKCCVCAWLRDSLMIPSVVSLLSERMHVGAEHPASSTQNCHAFDRSKQKHVQAMEKTERMIEFCVDLRLPPRFTLKDFETVADCLVAGFDAAGPPTQHAN